MRITIFGGTGPTGLLIIEQALAEGHEVVAYARTPAKLPVHERLTAVRGQLDDAASIGAAIRGSDAVLSTLGPTTKKRDASPLVVGYRNIVAAMREHGVTRLVAMGTPSSPDPHDGRDFRVSVLVAAIRTFQPAAYETIVAIGEIVRESGLQWTIVRFPFLSNGPRTPSINARNVGSKGGLRLSRANAAAYYVQQLTDTSQIGRAPFLSDE